MILVWTTSDRNTQELRPQNGNSSTLVGSSVVVGDGKVGLLVDAVALYALYWGVRRLVSDHMSNRRAVSSLDKMIEDNRKQRTAARLVDTIEAPEAGELLFNGKPTTLAELKRRLGKRRRRH